MDHINLFQTTAEFNAAYNGSSYVEPWVSYTMESSGIVYNKESGPTPPPPSPYVSMPLTIEITDGEGYIDLAEGLYYKLNDGEWTYVTGGGSGSGEGDGNNGTPHFFMVYTGDRIQFKRDYSTNGLFRFFNETITLRYIVYGNIMSIYSAEGFETLTYFPGGETEVFLSLFPYASGLTSAENLILPATALTDGCYARMFEYCTRLTAAPELPATALATGCYGQMFIGCTSLTTAPALPASALVFSCYEDMFNGCTSLMTAPALPATTLAVSCYQNMFVDCTSLVTAPELPATALASMCYMSMFSRCTNLTTAPELPAETLVNYCYSNMFNGCTNLNYIKSLATNITATQCTKNWLNNVASTGTFVKNSNMSSWTSGIDGIPSNWTVENAS